MPAAIEIRPCAESDLDALIALFRDSVRRIARRDYTEAQITAWAPDQIDRQAWARARANRPTWIAMIGDTRAGFSDLEPDGHIDMLFVHPDHQGLGVATALIDIVERTARTNGIAELFTEASITARPFFKQRGFRIITQQTVMKRGQALTNFQMRKSLTSD